MIYIGINVPTCLKYCAIRPYLGTHILPTTILDHTKFVTFSLYSLNVAGHNGANPLGDFNFFSSSSSSSSSFPSLSQKSSIEPSLDLNFLQGFKKEELGGIYSYKG